MEDWESELMREVTICNMIFYQDVLMKEQYKKMRFEKKRVPGE